MICAPPLSCFNSGAPSAREELSGVLDELQRVVGVHRPVRRLDHVAAVLLDADLVGAERVLVALAEGVERLRADLGRDPRGDELQRAPATPGSRPAAGGSAGPRRSGPRAPGRPSSPRSTASSVAATSAALAHTTSRSAPALARGEDLRREVARAARDHLVGDDLDLVDRERLAQRLAALLAVARVVGQHRDLRPGVGDVVGQPPGHDRVGRREPEQRRIALRIDQVGAALEQDEHRQLRRVGDGGDRRSRRCRR